MPSSAYNSTLWDPLAVLKVHNTGRCAGWAHSRGRNCANAIAWHNQKRAEDLIRVLSTKRPDPNDLEEDLYRLARYLLCRRWHQSQADNMVEKWRTSMEHFEAENAEGERPRQGRSSTIRSSSTVSATLPLFNSMSRSSSSSFSATASSAGFTRSSETRHLDSNSQSSPESERIAQLEATLATLIAEITNRSAERPPDAATPSRAQRSRATVSNSPPCTNTHVRRLAIDDTCPICHDDFLLRDQNRLVWCKSGCGRTVHKACFESWKRACIEDGRVVTCGVCRTPWTLDCTCE